MTTVDYGNYLEQQAQWATSLSRLARRARPDRPDRARELGDVVAATLRRMLRYGLPRIHL